MEQQVSVQRLAGSYLGVHPRMHSEQQQGRQQQHRQMPIMQP